MKRLWVPAAWWDQSWPVRWRKFQKQLLKYSEECGLLTVTDLTNYYDNIGLRELRHIVGSRLGAQEVVLDLFLNIIEQLSWNPDYLPSSLKGLPTINIEAFRLLANVLLFEVERIQIKPNQKSELTA